jgi:uncharacterized membrane protein
MIGWVYETSLILIFNDPWENRGFLYGFWLPIYGTGAVILLLLLARIVEKSIYVFKINVMSVVIFLIISVITTVVELCTGFVMEKIYQRRWWDYSDQWLNYDGIICPLATFRFAVGGIVLLYFLVPVVNGLFDKLALRKQQMIIAVLTVLFAMDLVLSLAIRGW